jgi:cell wall-associated NlpC family hydrolase
MLRALSVIVCAAWFLSAQTAPAAVLESSSANQPANSDDSVTIARSAVHFALHFRGVPYAWGASGPAGFDCSGLTRYVYAHFGIDLPHSTYAQWYAGRHIARSQLQPGDLVFFGMGHVGLWIGHGRFIHAPHTGRVVSVARLAQSWYAASYSGAVRITGSQRDNDAPARSSPRRTSGRIAVHQTISRPVD